MTVFEAARTHMIESQLRPNKVTDDRVLGAFASIAARACSCPSTLRLSPIPMKICRSAGGRYLMEPMVAARLLQAAGIARTDTALIIGAGTGYEAALTAILARNVVALEEDAELARHARSALVEHGIARSVSSRAHCARGIGPRAPFDVILFGGAVAEVPPDIVAQLAEGGRLFAVVKPVNQIGRATLTRRTGGVLARRVIFDAATPLLPGFAEVGFRVLLMA